MGKRNLAGIAVELSLIIDESNDWRMRGVPFKDSHSFNMVMRAKTSLIKMFCRLGWRTRTSDSWSQRIPCFCLLAHSCKDHIRNRAVDYATGMEEGDFCMPKTP